MQPDQKYMQRCLELARIGAGRVSPNPMVGCVIVCKDTIIGEGFHHAYGGPHAEINAIREVKNPDLFRDSILYVSLEPCAHWGKTPPCADAIISLGIPKVVIGCRDPFPEVNGKGMAKLESAGVDVITGVLEKECLELNKRFFTFHTKKRPYVILKWAQTMDGFIARVNYDSKWISGPYSRLMVHYSRSEEDAILVGTNTALYDNPQLTSRDMHTRNPLRIILDRNGRIPGSHHVMDKSMPTIVFTEKAMESMPNLEYEKLDFSHHIAGQILQKLYKRNIQSIIVEGGTKLLSAFIESSLWDEARVFHGQQSFGKGIQSPEIGGNRFEVQELDTDRLITWYNT